MRPITLQRLQVFCAVYESTSITAAAHQLQLSQPTVSRHLRDFEAALDLSLFVLEKGKIVPTPEADAIFAESQFLRSGLLRLENRIDGLRQGAGSRLLLMSVGLFANWPLPQVIAQLQRDMPALEIAVNIGTLSQQVHLLKTGVLDIGIVAGRVSEDGLNVRKMGSGSLKALIPREHTLAKNQTISIAQLAKFDAISLSPRGPIGRLLNEAITSQGLQFSTKVVANAMVAVPGLALTFNRPSVVDNFTASTCDPEKYVQRPLEKPINFDVVLLSNKFSGTSSLFEEKIGSILKELNFDT